MYYCNSNIYQLTITILLTSLISACSNQVKTDVTTDTYEPTWESLSKHNISPEWFKDAKFGIYFHWGLFTVPEYYDEKYPRWMYYDLIDKKG